jgi:prolyl oligopeptidase
MKKIIVLSLLLTACSTKQKNEAVHYPTTKQDTVTDIYFGHKVADPYRWLEDDHAEATQSWVKEQNKCTFAYLEKIPFRNKIKQQLQKMWNYERISAPFKKGRYTYFYKNDGLQSQSILYRKDEQGKEEIFLNPNTFSADGTTSLGEVSFTQDGSLLAYSISVGGSDWRKVIVMDAQTKKQLEDTLVDVKFSGLAWYKNDGFYYSSYDKPNGSELTAKTDQHKLYFHQLGTKQQEDVVIFGDNLKRRYVGASLTEDMRFLVITAANSTSGNELYIKDMNQAASAIIPIVQNFDSDSYVVDNEGDTLFVETNLNAPNKRVVQCLFSKASPENWTDFIKETDHVLSTSTGGGYFFAAYMKDAVSMVVQYDKKGNKVREIHLPGVGTASGFGGEKNDAVLYYSFTNYITPGSIYAYSPTTGKSTLYFQPKIDFNPDEYTSTQVFYTSKDGTKIPMIISYKKGTKLDGTAPTILYGYGGFNISLTPSFSVANAVWMKNGGIYAVPNIRGGGEYGKAWHDAGTQMHKQNVFDDFIAAAHFLIEQHYTSSSYLAIRGGSNGGLLVGAVMTQAPHLMKVALPAVGVLDMLRYHKFTAGAGWAYDYGTSDDNEAMFLYLKAYSPVHNVRKGETYPATLITTGDHDDRVVPAHSFKFAAQLQANQSGDNPVLIRIETNAGHGAGKSVEQVVQENADIQSFTLYNMGVSLKSN